MNTARRRSSVGIINITKEEKFPVHEAYDGLVSDLWSRDKPI